MKTVVTLCFMALLGLVVAQNDRGLCGCRRVFVFCANDYTTYHSICEYKCKHPSTPFQEWYILYEGPCYPEPDTTTERSTTREPTTWRPVGTETSETNTPYDSTTEVAVEKCNCQADYKFCAGKYYDHEEYNSVCEYRCKNGNIPFKKSFILNDGECEYMNSING